MIDKEYKEQINKVFMRITFFKLFFIGLEALFIYFTLKNEIELCLAIIGLMLVTLITLFMNLWEAINEERLNNDR